MTAFKQFSSQDLIVTPFKVNKNFTFLGSSSLIASDVQIDRFIGTNLTGTFDPQTDPTTGYINTGSYQRLVYNSIKELYYTNFLSSSKGDISVLTIEEKGVLIQANNLQPQYDNYLQSTLVPHRYFPTSSGAQIGVISVPVKLYGEQISPKTFTINTPNGSLLEDGEGNLYFDSNPYVSSGYVTDDYFLTITGSKIGNIIYPHGIAVITLDSVSGSSGLINSFTTGSDVTMSFSSTFTIYETQYKCTIRESEFNFSLNPTLLSGSLNEYIYNFATGSYFSPYITTVGLYNENQDLLAVAKLAQPLPSSRTTDMNIIVNLDR